MQVKLSQIEIVQADVVCTIFLSLQNIQEDGDDSCIDQISEHRTDDGNDEERLDGIAVFIAYGTHVGHRIGGCTQAEATYSCARTAAS